MTARYLQAALFALAMAWTATAPAAAQYYGTDINDDLTAAAREALSQAALQSHGSGAVGRLGPEVALRIVFPSEQTGLDNIMMTELFPREGGAHHCEAIAVKSGGNVIQASFISKKDVRPGYTYDVVASDSMGDLYLVGRIRVSSASEQSYVINAPLLTPGSPRYTPASVTSDNPEPSAPAAAQPAQRTQARAFAQLLRSQERADPMLGLRGITVTPQILALAGSATRSFHGVIVAKVQQGSYAQSAGLRGGDVVFSVDGHPCGSMQQLVNVTQDRQRPASAIDVAFLRSDGNGGANVLHTKVPSARMVALLQALGAAAKPVPALGMSGVTATPRLFTIAGGNRHPFKGVVVFQLQPGGLAQSAGINSGEAITAVDGRPCATVEQLTALMQRYGQGQSLDLTIVHYDPKHAPQTRHIDVVIGAR